MTPLEAEIRRIIAIDGPIPVAHYMALCLAHPAHGYYLTRDPLGLRGDFTTAPEISQMFGELIGLWAATVWQSLGRPAPVNLVELGPGRGTLMADLLRAIRIVPDFSTAVQVHLVEISPALRRLQQATLAQTEMPPAWHEDLATVPGGPLIVIANEFFDALPVHQMVLAADGWHERMVGIGPDGRLAFALHPDPIGRLDGLLPASLRQAPVGALFEWRADTVAGEIAQRVVRDGGVALAIDYGHGESAAGETLQAVHRHGFADPLEAPGDRDLTAHVDFAALARSAAAAGAAVYGPIDQGEFLRRLGIEARAARLRLRAGTGRPEAVDVALARLVGQDQMGTLFKVLAMASPGLAPPGFED